MPPSFPLAAAVARNRVEGRESREEQGSRGEEEEGGRGEEAGEKEEEPPPGNADAQGSRCCAQGWA